MDRDDELEHIIFSLRAMIHSRATDIFDVELPQDKSFLKEVRSLVDKLELSIDEYIKIQK